MDPHVVPSDDHLLVSVGWVPERGSYFATVLDRTQVGPDRVLLAEGHPGSPAITDPTTVLAAVSKYTSIPDGLLEDLTDEAAVQVEPATSIIADPAVADWAVADPTAADPAGPGPALADRPGAGRVVFSHPDAEVGGPWPEPTTDGDPTTGGPPPPEFLEPDTSPGL